MKKVSEVGIRRRNAKDKSKYIKHQNNSDVKTTYLEYLDANNLYWWGMIKKLLTHRFGWEKVNVLLLDEIVKKDKTEYILEVNEGILKRYTIAITSCHF